MVATKQPPGFWFFSIAMGADYSFEVKNIEIWVPAFFKHDNSSVATVKSKCQIEAQKSMQELSSFFAKYLFDHIKRNNTFQENFMIRSFGTNCWILWARYVEWKILLLRLTKFSDNYIHDQKN